MDHEFLTAKDRKFWEWSFQDTRLDIKAYIEYIVEETEGKKVHYVGHSMGSVGMLAALSDPTDRETADYIAKNLDTFYCLAPVVYSVRVSQIFPFFKKGWVS